MALYRTYRPATFAEVVGQEHVTEPLSRALDSGRINHAYLFSGPRGCGKTSSARILARSLNCEQGPTSTPCGECSSCVALRPGGPGNLDVIELDAASHGGVDDTRELRDRAFYAPSESRYRVFIVDEAHMVTTAGFNALLKIVEEPPEHLIFVFATTEPEKVLPTIRSRTHHYPFRLLAPPVMRGLLERICAQEGVTVAPEVFPLVIRAGGGSPRDSLSILDQLLAGADERGVTYDRALALLGVTDIALIDDAIDALATGDGAALFSTVERLVDAGHDPRRFAVDLLERLRDLILLQAVPDAADRGLVEAPGDQLARMQAQIENLGLASLTRFAETAHAALGEMRGTTSPRLLLEVMCARMLLPAASTDDAALLQRIERIESGVGPAAGARPAVTAAGAASVAASAKAAPNADSETPSKFMRPSQRKAMEEAAAKAAADRTEAEEAEADKAEDDPASSGHGLASSGHGLASSGHVLASSGHVLTSSGHDLASSGHETPTPTPAPEPAPTPEPAPSAPVAERAPAPAPAPTPVPEPKPTPTPPSTEMPKRPGTPTAPQPPARVPAAEPRAAQAVSEDDIPLPDEPFDEFDAPPPDEPSTRVAKQPDPEPEPVAAEDDLESMRKRFQDVRLAVRERSKSLEPMLSAAVIEGLDGDTVVLGHPIEVLVTRLSAPHAVEILRAALKEVFGKDLDVRTVKQTPGAASSGPATRATEKPAPKRQTFDRPSQSRGQSSAGESSAETSPPPEPAPEPEEPEPPRADDEIPDDERAEMVADAHTGESEGRLDPDQVAIELLKSELGARPLES